MVSICLFILGVREDYSLDLDLFSGVRFTYDMSFNHVINVLGYEPVVALCVFMGSRVFGWDKCCYFESMDVFAKSLFKGVSFEWCQGEDFLNICVSGKSTMTLSMLRGFDYDWADSMDFISVDGYDIDVCAHDFLTFSIPVVVRKGRLTFDVRGVSDSLTTRFYFSLRRCVMKASEGGHYSFEGLKGMFYGGERLFIRACMYHFVRMVPGNIRERTLSSASRLFKEYPFWRDFVLYLGDDFYNYLPGGGRRGKYEGIVDLARKV